MLFKELIYHVYRSLTQPIVKDSIEYDIVIPCHKGTITTLPDVIKCLRRFLSYRKIFVVAPLKYKEKIENLSKKIQFVDGNTVVDSISKESIEDWMTEKGWSSKSSGWLFQQIIKMGMCRYPGISDYYLCWDADTYLLNPIRFFSDDKKQLITMRRMNFGGGNDYHKTVKKVLNVEKQVNFTYINHFMMFEKKVMNEIIKNIDTLTKYEGNWVKKITIASGPLTKWSEFEAYGHYTQYFYPEKFEYVLCNSKNSVKTVIIH